MPHFSRVAFGLIGFITASLLSARADSLDETIVALMQKRGIPGASLAIVQEGRIVRAKGYGVIEAGGTAAVTEDTLFQAASISKPVSALATLRLVEAGKLQLDADVNTMLKSWKIPENEFTLSEKVTLRRLLSHTGGLTVSGFGGYGPDDTLPTLRQMLTGEKPANSSAVHVDLLPGSRFRYSGGGYIVLQQLLVDTTDRPFPEFMRETVLKPLGMLASGFEQPLPEMFAAKAATGHGLDGRPLPGRWRIHPEMAPAGLWTTPSDLARLAMAMQQALAGKTDATISPATAQLMVTPVNGRFGVGFVKDGSGPTERFSFNGRNQGFDSQLVAYRETGQAAVLVTNINANPSFFPRAMAAIAQHYGWRDYPAYAPPKAIEDKEPSVTAAVRKNIEQLPPPPAWGAIKSIALVTRQTTGAFRNYRYYVVFENETVMVTCSFDGEGKVSGFRIQPD